MFNNDPNRLGLYLPTDPEIRKKMHKIQRQKNNTGVWILIIATFLLFALAVLLP
jgi:hypothetical protein